MPDRENDNNRSSIDIERISTYIFDPKALGQFLEPLFPKALKFLSSALGTWIHNLFTHAAKERYEKSVEKILRWASKREPINNVLRSFFGEFMEKLDAEEARKKIESYVEENLPENPNVPQAAPLQEKLAFRQLLDTDEIKQAIAELVEKTTQISDLYRKSSLKLSFIDFSYEGPGGRFLDKAYSMDWIEREDAFSRLDEFTKTDDPKESNFAFSWLLLHGKGGMGKTRLAYEYCTKKLNEGWYCGFLENDALNTADFNVWLPDKNTLIVIDYAARKTETVRNMFISILGRKEEYRCAVRVLLLDRNGPDDIYGVPDNPIYSRIPWCSRLLGNDYYRNAVQKAHDGRPLKLERLSDDEAWNIIKLYVGEKNPTSVSDKDSRERHLGTLRKIDPLMRPLFAALYGYLLGDGLDIEDRDLIKHDLIKFMDKVIAREEQLFRENLNPIDSNLLAFLFITGKMVDGDVMEKQLKDNKYGIREHITKDFISPRDLAKRDYDRFARLGGILREDQWRIQPFEPDVLANYHVYLTCFHRGNSAEISQAFVLTAWRIDPKRTFDFLMDFLDDFPDDLFDQIHSLLLIPPIEDWKEDESISFIEHASSAAISLSFQFFIRRHPRLSKEYRSFYGKIISWMRDHKKHMDMSASFRQMIRQAGGTTVSISLDNYKRALSDWENHKDSHDIAMTMAYLALRLLQDIADEPQHEFDNNLLAEIQGQMRSLLEQNPDSDLIAACLFSVMTNTVLYYQRSGTLTEQAWAHPHNHEVTAFVKKHKDNSSIALSYLEYLANSMDFFIYAASPKAQRFMNEAYGKIISTTESASSEDLCLTKMRAELSMMAFRLHRGLQGIPSDQLAYYRSLRNIFLEYATKYPNNRDIAEKYHHLCENLERVKDWKL